MEMWIFNTINIISVVLVGLLTTLYLYIKFQFSVWPRKNVPFITPHLLFGNFGDFVTKKMSLSQLTLDLYKKFKGKRFGGVWEIYRPRLFILDPSLLRDILVKDFDTWSDRGIAVNSHVNPLDQNLINLEGKKWKLVRTRLTPTFTSAKLKKMHNLMLECGENFGKYLDAVASNGEPVEVREINAKSSTDVIGSCVFGIQMNSLSHEDAVFRKMGKKIFETSRKKSIVQSVQHGFPSLFKLLKLSTTRQEITEFFIKITKETFDYREKNNIQRHDFIDLLGSLKNSDAALEENGVVFDAELLAAQAFVFFAAGSDTTSTTVSVCLHELAVNQNIQDRLREEVHRIKAANNEKISWDALKNMKYLDMVVQESMRKYPIIPFTQRVSVKPYQIPDTNITLPVGSTCTIPIHALHHDPEYFPDPEKFDPERFTLDAISRRPDFTFIPLGAGPRVCIARRFAEHQMKITIVNAVDTFKISLCEKSQNPLRYETGTRFLRPEIGVWLNISKITPKRNSLYTRE